MDTIDAFELKDHTIGITLVSTSDGPRPLVDREVKWTPGERERAADWLTHVMPGVERRPRESLNDACYRLLFEGSSPMPGRASV